jgi:hypothetical protein
LVSTSFSVKGGRVDGTRGILPRYGEISRQDAKAAKRTKIFNHKGHEGHKGKTMSRFTNHGSLEPSSQRGHRERQKEY